mmetsp:Transcript_77832/g.172466  ORF Transcript_77832/g.172466 Transcript_77832/m.172466 type:complete len:440 (-) Transcript_77832:1558-2877(-)
MEASSDDLDELLDRQKATVGLGLAAECMPLLGPHHALCHVRPPALLSRLRQLIEAQLLHGLNEPGYRQAVLAVGVEPKSTADVGAVARGPEHLGLPGLGLPHGAPHEVQQVLKALHRDLRRINAGGFVGNLADRPLVPLKKGRHIEATPGSADSRVSFRPLLGLWNRSKRPRYLHVGAGYLATQGEKGGAATAFQAATARAGAASAAASPRAALKSEVRGSRKRSDACLGEETTSLCLFQQEARWQSNDDLDELLQISPPSSSPHPAIAFSGGCLRAGLVEEGEGIQDLHLEVHAPFLPDREAIGFKANGWPSCGCLAVASAPLVHLPLLRLGDVLRRLGQWSSGLAPTLRLVAATHGANGARSPRGGGAATAMTAHPAGRLRGAIEEPLAVQVVVLLPLLQDRRLAVIGSGHALVGTSDHAVPNVVAPGIAAPGGASS